MATREENIHRYENLLLQIDRPGIKTVLRSLIRGRDFYTAPASQQYYGAFEGGLLEHTLNVFDILYEKLHTPGTQIYSKLHETGITDENILVTGLLHGLSKVRFYEEDSKNQKCYDPAIVATYSPQDIKHDKKGDYVWVNVPVYRVQDMFPIGGPGARAVIVLMKHMKLEWPEIMAIMYADGYGEHKNCFYEAVRQYPIVLAMREADMEAMLLRDKQSM